MGGCEARAQQHGPPLALMSPPLSIVDPHAHEPIVHQPGRLRRLGGRARLLAGLLAIYGPVALVLVSQRGALDKAYFLIAIWAVEAIVWYAQDSISRRRRGGGDDDLTA